MFIWKTKESLGRYSGKLTLNQEEIQKRIIILDFLPTLGLQIIHLIYHCLRSRSRDCVVNFLYDTLNPDKSCINH